MSIVTRQNLEVMMQNNHLVRDVVGRALVHLLDRQTRDEQQTEHTKYNNGVGFTPGDAKMGTSMAQQYQRKSWLSEKQINYWRIRDKRGTMRLVKYWAQLNEVAEEKAAAAQKEMDFVDPLETKMKRLQADWTNVVASKSIDVIRPIVAELRRVEAQLNVDVPFVVKESIYG